MIATRVGGGQVCSIIGSNEVFFYRILDYRNKEECFATKPLARASAVQSTADDTNHVPITAARRIVFSASLFMAGTAPLGGACRRCRTRLSHCTIHVPTEDLLAPNAETRVRAGRLRDKSIAALPTQGKRFIEKS